MERKLSLNPWLLLAAALGVLLGGCAPEDPTANAPGMTPEQEAANRAGQMTPEQEAARAQRPR